MSTPDQPDRDGRNGQDGQVEMAYGRLATALTPPPDLLARVEGRIRARRRRRTAGAASAAAVALGGVATLVVVTMGDGNGPDEALDPASSRSALTIQLADGTPYTFEGFRVSCGEEQGVEQIEVDAGDPPVDDTLSDPLLTFSADLADVADGRTFELPYVTTYRDTIDGGAVRPPQMILFFALPGGGDSNELSSAQEGASGTVEVVSASCGATPHLELVVDAVLGSEVSQESVPITGQLDE